MDDFIRLKHSVETEPNSHIEYLDPEKFNLSTLSEKGKKELSSLLPDISCCRFWTLDVEYDDPQAVRYKKAFTFDGHTGNVSSELLRNNNAIFCIRPPR